MAAITLVVAVTPRIAVAAVNADTGTCRADMRARSDAILADTGTGADGTDMRSGADTVAADVGADTDAQDINMRADAIGIGRCAHAQQGQSDGRNDQGFHGSSRCYSV